MTTTARRTTLVAAAAAMLATSTATGESKRSPWHDLPNVTRGSTKELNQVQVKCQRLGTSKPRRARCLISQVMISRPDKVDVQREVNAIRTASRRNVGKAFKRACREVDDWSKDGKAYFGHPTFVGLVRKACAKKDRRAFVDALVWREKHVAGRTCDLTIWHPMEYDFEQLNANTWITRPGPEGVCNVSLTITLWRDKSDTTLWNFKQVRAVPPGQTGPLCKAIKDSVQEWRWRSAGAKDIADCDYIDM